jgi:triphosphatase
MAKPGRVKKLDPEKRLPSCLKKILRARIDEAFSYRSSALRKVNAEAVHDMRVAVRRLLAVLSIFRSCFKKNKPQRYTTELKALLGALGAVRDEDIFIASLIRYADTAVEPDHRALEMFIGQEQDERDAHKQRLKKIIHRMEAKHFTRKFNEFLNASL